MSRTHDLQWINNPSARENGQKKAATDFISREVVRDVRNFHKSFAEYRVTPLQNLQGLAKELGIGGIWVKDESYRFGLNAFKVLGGAYAIGKYLSKKLGCAVDNLSFAALRSAGIKEKFGEITFVTATDGNHGRGVAWAARQLGQKAVVYMPKGSAPHRVESIRAEGAEVTVTDLNYDEAVRLAGEQAQKYGWVMVQDTAWEGYEEIPTWIMQGYATMVDEAVEQLQAQGIAKPTHVILQAGVGAFAGAVQGYFASLYGEERPITVIVEPDEAACIYESASAGDGKAHAVTGDMSTIMVGLACGEPNTIAWGILRDYADMYVKCPDYVAARGMRILANPLAGDPRVISGESGAVGLGLLSLLLQRAEYRAIATALQLDRNSKVLVFSTEGDTDPVGYRRVVWDGAYPSI